jgi:hypothetical protein
VTANFMGTYPGLDYFRFQHVLDVASYDSYPRWGAGDATDEEVAHDAAFKYDITRGILRKPWILMESTPSQVNWQNICRPKKPGMHLLSSMQAVAHGADTVQYFQWRKSRGAFEKLHGAVVDHVGNENTRVFRDVTEVGEWLEKLQPVLHAELLEGAPRRAVELGPCAAVRHVDLVDIAHQGYRLLFPDVLVKGPAEIVRYIVFAVGERARAAEAVHNGAGLAVYACLYLVSVDRTMPLVERMSRLEHRDF